MKKTLISALLALFFVGTTVSACFAANSPEEAKAMVKEIAAYMRANGKARTLEEINDQKGQFVRGELYLFAIDRHGLMLAHGANRNLIGNNMIDFKDPDGKYFIREFIDVAEKGSGWVAYKWVNPVSRRTEDKYTYIEAEQDFIFGCGVYPQDDS